MKRALTDLQKIAAYLLNQSPGLGYSQKRIGIMMDVSQPTISNAIDDVRNELEKQVLMQQRNDAECKLADGYGHLKEAVIFLE